jgi:hypothetical protein
VHIEATGADWVQYRCTDARNINPQIVARLAARGTPVVALTELPRSLEDVYLSIVADTGDGGWGIGDASSSPILHSPSCIPELEEVQQ